MATRVCEQMMVASGLRPPSRSTLDRAARDLGAYAAVSFHAIEPVVRANEILDPRARSISLGLDRTGVPMRHGEDGPRTFRYSDLLRRSRPIPRRRADI